jgi:single-stranded-DNA-specific exonuclease
MKIFDTIKWQKAIYKLDNENYSLEELLYNRLWEEANLFWDLNDLHNPFLLKDMDLAVDRILLAKENNEKVAVFGDYDVDWVTSTAIMTHLLFTLWIQATYRIPHRIEDWYGLKDYFVDELKEKWVSLIITVDCGIRDDEIISRAKEKWVDIIVTDHHEQGEILPKNAVAVVDPKRLDCGYPFDELAWAWVALKVVDAVLSKIYSEEQRQDYLKKTIDIASVWTIADCMNIIWENRIIVSEGLKQIKYSRSRWLREMLQYNSFESIDCDTVWFDIAPKLNSAWRLDTPYKALKILLNNNWDSISENILEIERLNEQRKKLTSKFMEDALSCVDKTDKILFYYNNDIPHWIAGIIAWRLTEMFNKPSIVLASDDDKIVWSSRSPEYFSIVDMLDELKDNFVYYWGHNSAAWFTLLKNNFDKFKLDLDNFWKNTEIKYEPKSINIDKIISINNVSFNFLWEINKFAPFWRWNEKPVFLIKDFVIKKVSYLGKTNMHLKFENAPWFKVYGFNMWEYYYDLNKLQSVNIIAELSEDYWMWRKNIMIRVIDVIK